MQSDPSLLRPTTINVNVKATLTDILSEAVKSGGGFELIDKLRSSVGADSTIIDAEFDEVPSEEDGENDG